MNKKHVSMNRNAFNGLHFTFPFRYALKKTIRSLFCSSLDLSELAKTAKKKLQSVRIILPSVQPNFLSQLLDM